MKFFAKEAKIVYFAIALFKKALIKKALINPPLRGSAPHPAQGPKAPENPIKRCI
jgi:hypothetical protein